MRIHNSGPDDSWIEHPEIEQFIKDTWHLTKEEGIQEGREAERQDIDRVIVGLKRTLWNDDEKKHLANIMREDTLNEVLALITSRSNNKEV